MICPNCEREIKVKDGKAVLFVVGQDMKTGKTYCSECVEERVPKEKKK